jgi:bla regulator protein blaR1
MKTSNLLLTFLLNALWQIPLITGAAALGAWSVRKSSAKYRHWIWVCALLLSLLVPIFAASRLWANNETPTVATNTVFRTDFVTLPSVRSPFTDNATIVSKPSSVFVLNTFAAEAIIGVYVAFLLFGVFRLAKAWRATRRISGSSHNAAGGEVLDSVLEKCQHLIGRKNVQILCSESLPVPVTLGIGKPLIILPAELVREGNVELLTSAIAHEFVHVARRDYLLNLVYELVFVFLSFHPVTVLLRRRIKQTRELLCDELVADRVLEPDVYARSLVTLASAAPALRRLSVNATVGIADADILEVRVMSLMNKSKLYPRSKRLLLIGVAVLLAVPSLTAMAFAMRFDVNRSAPLTQDQEAKQKEKEKEKERVTAERRSREFEDGVRAGEREGQRRKIELYTGFAVTEERERHMEEEMKARAAMNATLMRLAKIPMDQAIQIALSLQPGKVLESSLGAERWEAPGQLAKDGYVFYHVTILNGDENNPTINHVLVNALDGTVIRNEKELPRKMRSPVEP